MLQPTRKRRIVDWAGLVIGVGAALFGLGLFVVGVARPLWEAYAARDWMRATCRVVRADASRHVDSDGDVSFRMALLYTFEHGGRDHRGTRLDFVDDRSDSTERALRDRFPAAGTSAACWFDPSHPGRSVIRRHGWAGWRTLIPSLFLMVFGLGFSSGSVRRAPRQRVLRDGRLMSIVAPAPNTFPDRKGASGEVPEGVGWVRVDSM